MTRYYYVVNRDGTTRKNFKPFKDDPDYAEAPDWVNDNRVCGNALHIVSDNPCKALLSVIRKDPVAHEVEPIDLKLEYGGKFRCRAVKRLRTFSDEEFINFFMVFIFPHTENKANLICSNGHLGCLNKCIEVGTLPTAVGADSAAKRGNLNCLTRCIEVGVLPTAKGADYAAQQGNLECLNTCIKVGVLPTVNGIDWATTYGHLDVLNRGVELGIMPTYCGVERAANNGYANCVARCAELGIFPITYEE